MDAIKQHLIRPQKSDQHPR